MQHDFYRRFGAVSSDPGVSDCCAEEEAEPEGKTFILPAGLHSSPQLWPPALDSD